MADAGSGGSGRDAGRGDAQGAGARSDAARPDADREDEAGADEGELASDASAASSPDAAPASGGAGREDGCPAGAPLAVNRVRLHPAPGRAAELAGARIQGSNSGPTRDFVDLATLDQAPAEGRFSEITFTNERRFRYVKLTAEGSAGSVAELAFYRGAVPIEGEPFGTVGAEPATTFGRAFDGDVQTVFSGRPTGNYVGLDIGGDAVVAAPSFDPPSGSFEEAPRVSLATATPGAEIRYTLDGSNPTRERGALFDAPVAVDAAGGTIKAIAYAECFFDSPVVSASYEIAGREEPAGEPQARGQKSYHIGNSLTDTIHDWLEPIADSTGVDHEYARWTIPGAPIAEIEKNPGVGFGTPEGAQNITSFARSFAPIDHMSVQPFADPSLGPQGGAAIEMYEAVHAHSPDVQLWIYAQWPPRTEWRNDSLAMGAGWAEPSWSVPSEPTSWEEALSNQLLYHEAFRSYVDERVPGKGVLIVPGGPALVALKRAIESGEIEGMRDFDAAHFEDELHLSTKGQYFISLVFYACLYRQSPEGRVLHEGSTLTAAQARSYQRIAWEAVRSYRWSGVSQ